MKITEVRIKLMEDSSDRLRGFCSITFDDSFVIRDLKIIEGANGPFVAMPSRKLTGHCPNCGSKNHLRASYCNQCGIKLKQPHIERGPDQRAKLYADIAHPINSECREQIQTRVIDEYFSEIEESKEPGYRSKYDDYFSDAGEDYDHSDEDNEQSSRSAKGRERSGPPDPERTEELTSPPELEPETRQELDTESTSIERTEERSDLKGPHSRSPEKPLSDAHPPRQHKFGEGIFED